jgi:hypothetical protein
LEKAVFYGVSSSKILYVPNDYIKAYINPSSYIDPYKVSWKAEFGVDNIKPISELTEDE